MRPRCVGERQCTSVASIGERAVPERKREELFYEAQVCSWGGRGMHVWSQQTWLDGWPSLRGFQ